MNRRQIRIIVSVTVLCISFYMLLFHEFSRDAYKIGMFVASILGFFELLRECVAGSKR